MEGAGAKNLQLLFKKAAHGCHIMKQSFNDEARMANDEGSTNDECGG
jgi:hypothetical protein